MKKIGFIDYYLDEWHANNYPTFFKQWTEGFEVAYAWGQMDKPGGLTSAQWGEKYGVEVLSSMEEVRSSRAWWLRCCMKKDITSSRRATTKRTDR